MTSGLIFLHIVKTSRKFTKLPRRTLEVLKILNDRLDEEGYRYIPRYGDYFLNIMDDNGNQLQCFNVVGQPVDYPLNWFKDCSGYKVRTTSKYLYILFMNTRPSEHNKFADSGTPDERCIAKYEEIEYDSVVNDIDERKILGLEIMCEIDFDGILGISEIDLDKIQRIRITSAGGVIAIIDPIWVKLRIVKNRQGIYRLPFPAMKWSKYRIQAYIEMKNNCLPDVTIYGKRCVFNNELENKKKFNKILWFKTEIYKYKVSQIGMCDILISGVLLKINSRLTYVCYNESGEIDPNIVEDVQCIAHSVPCYGFSGVDEKLFNCDIHTSDINRENEPIILQYATEKMSHSENHDKHISNIIMDYDREKSSVPESKSLIFHPLNVNTMYNGIEIEPSLGCKYNGFFPKMDDVFIKANWLKPGMMAIYIEGMNIMMIGDSYINLKYHL
jgi:hypothetical protein